MSADSDDLVAALLTTAQLSGISNLDPTKAVTAFFATRAELIARRRTESEKERAAYEQAAAARRTVEPETDYDPFASQD